MINELMYNPISGNSADEYLELYNRRNSSVDLSGWKFVDGKRHEFRGNVDATQGRVADAQICSRLRTEAAALGATCYIQNPPTLNEFLALGGAIQEVAAGGRPDVCL